MTTYLTTDTDLTAVASAIRTKGGTSSALQWPDGFVSAVQAIPSGGGGGGVNTCTMTIGDDGEVTCSNFSDHEPTGQYVAVSTYGVQNEYGKNVIVYFSGVLPTSAREGRFIAASDISSPGYWVGYISGTEGGAALYDAEVVDGSDGGITTAIFAGTYTATVIEV